MNAAYVLFFAVFALVVGRFIVRMFRLGGFKAAMFGAPIRRTVGEVSGDKTKLTNTLLRVHLLGKNSDGKAVGLEFVAKTFASYQMMPISLSLSETKQLVKLLESATQDQQPENCG